MDYNLVHSIWTVLVLIAFIVIVSWAWSGKRKQSFDEAARTPLDDDDSVVSQQEGKRHG